MKSAFLTLSAFTLTLFTSALLLFMVQPMVGKLILPLLGGTPAVWNTCMVFFQALLLGGYSYAHFSTKYLGVRRQSIVHLALMMIPFLFVFPITIHEDLLSDTESFLIPKLLGVLFLSAGIPFFIVSASAPLLQRWFSRTGHPAASDPYFLYAASNLGSMIALIGYPAFVEPYLTLEQQRWGWGMGYGVLVLFTGVCVWLLRIAPDSVRETSTQASNNPAKPIPQSIILRWIFLGAVPSSLMLGATTYMTTDIAAIPLLWVAPLAIYLLSFILVFARIPAGVHFTMILLMPLGVLLLLFLMLSGIKPGQDIMNLIGVHLAVLFLVSMVCHGELARSRPAPENLTSFYLYMSLGACTDAFPHHCGVSGRPCCCLYACASAWGGRGYQIHSACRPFISRWRSVFHHDFHYHPKLGSGWVKPSDFGGLAICPSHRFWRGLGHKPLVSWKIGWCRSF